MLFGHVTSFNIQYQALRSIEHYKSTNRLVEILTNSAKLDEMLCDEILFLDIQSALRLYLEF